MVISASHKVEVNPTFFLSIDTTSTDVLFGCTVECWVDSIIGLEWEVVELGEGGFVRVEEDKESWGWMKLPVGLVRRYSLVKLLISTTDDSRW